MAQRTRKQIEVEFPFYVYLKLFYEQERKKIVGNYKQLTKKFLSFNDPSEGTAYLRRPQFEALEMYVFLKEFCDNKHLHRIFEDWYNRRDKFENRPDTGVTAKGQFTLFNPLEFNQSEDKETFLAVFQQMREVEQSYPNYIFALTMGLGKTILMATSIFYEFLLANKYPKDERYCHNVLVFAPDKTVLQSLREIESFDKSLVIPPEYVIANLE